MPNEKIPLSKSRPLLGARYSPLALIERERHVLGEIASGVPLAGVLHGLLQAVEAHSGNVMKTSVLFLSEDGGHMLHGAAPSLPKAYNDAIHGIAIGEGIGSCGTAAELAKNPSQFDVVFSDVVMPGISGIELGHEIRRKYRNLPVVLTSGYSHVLAKNGTYGFELLHKPYSVEQLSRILRKAAGWQGRSKSMPTDG